MKNLDKPLLRKEFEADSSYFCHYHELPRMKWFEIHEMIGSPLGSHPGDELDEIHYLKYLEWCKLANSPLYKALG